MLISLRPPRLKRNEYLMRSNEMGALHLNEGTLPSSSRADECGVKSSRLACRSNARASYLRLSSGQMGRGRLNTGSRGVFYGGHAGLADSTVCRPSAAAAAAAVAVGLTPPVPRSRRSLSTAKGLHSVQIFAAADGTALCQAGGRSVRGRMDVAVTNGRHL